MAGILLLACGAQTNEVGAPTAESTTEPASPPPQCTEELITWSGPAGACTGPWKSVEYVDIGRISELAFQAHPIVPGTCSPVGSTLLCRPKSTDTCTPQALQALAQFIAARPNGLVYDSSSGSWPTTRVDASRVQLHCYAQAYGMASLQTELAYLAPGTTEADARIRFPLGIGPPLPPRPPMASYACTSCDALPTRSAREVQDKFDCIWRQRADLLTFRGPAPAGLQWPDVELLSAQLKLVFERHGQHLERLQVERTVGLYRDEPRAHRMCGVSAHRVLTRPAPGSEWALQYCTRLTNDHVPTALLWSHPQTVLEPCHQLLRNAATPEDLEQVASLNRMLLARVYAEMGARLGLARDTSERVDAIAVAFTSMQAWYQAREAAGAELGLDQERSVELAALLAQVESSRRLRDPLLDALLTGSSAEPNQPLEKQIGDVDPSRVDRDALTAALSNTHGLSSEMEQELIRAAFADPLRTGRVALRGILLVDLLGVVIEPLVNRLDVVSPSHDLACLLADCGPVGSAPSRVTPTSRLWALVAALDETAATQDAAVVATPFALSGWRDLFAELARHDAEVKSALSEMVDRAYVPGEVDRLDRADLPASSIRLVSALGRAKSRHRKYVATGQLIAVSSRELATGLDAQKRDDVVRYLGAQRADLESRSARHGDEIIRLVQGLVAERQSSATLARLVEKRGRLVEEGDILTGRRRAHMTAVSETDRASDLTHALAQVQGAIDGSPYVTVTNHPVRTLSARDARYDGAATTIGEVTSQAPITMSAGQLLSVAVEGQWSPTCALSRAPFVAPDGTGVVPVTLSRSLTGPEGYSVVWTGSAYDASRCPARTSTTPPASTPTVGSCACRAVGSARYATGTPRPRVC